MKTIKKMWSMSKPGTALALLLGLALLLALGVIWWLPVGFGYPIYAVVVNAIVTLGAAFMVWLVVDLVND